MFGFGHRFFVQMLKLDVFVNLSFYLVVFLIELVF